MNEVGLNAVPWATAIEVLAAPQGRNVRKTDCTELIGNVPFGEELSEAKYKVRINKKQITVTLPQRIFLYLYDARSKFVHGDDVSTELLLPFGEEAPSILSLASTVYRTALTAYLEEHWPLEPTPELDGSSSRAILEHALRENLGPYEDHLLQAIGKSYWD